MAQYGKLATLVKSTAENVQADAIILAEDFNIPARIQSLQPLRRFLRDAWLDAGDGWGATMPEFLPLTRIDHVWVSESVEVRAVRVERLAGSDHRAVIVDFALKD
jgi:endonuclease/exonuclease/phosphatase (EEP) superfamily protein YafD